MRLLEEDALAGQLRRRPPRPRPGRAPPGPSSQVLRDRSALRRPPARRISRPRATRELRTVVRAEPVAGAQILVDPHVQHACLLRRACALEGNGGELVGASAASATTNTHNSPVERGGGGRRRRDGGGGVVVAGARLGRRRVAGAGGGRGRARGGVGGRGEGRRAGPGAGGGRAGRARRRRARPFAFQRQGRAPGPAAGRRSRGRLARPRRRRAGPSPSPSSPTASRACWRPSSSTCGWRARSATSRIAASGHWYFSLKDANAQIRGGGLEDGDPPRQVPPTGRHEGPRARRRSRSTPPRASTRSRSRSSSRIGKGSLQQAFEELKEKLEKEGPLRRGAQAPAADASARASAS